MAYLVVSSVVLTIFGLLFAVDFALSLFSGKKPDYSQKTAQVKFASLIAARNEEDVISGVVESLLNQNYPKELHDVYVLINNTTDNTKSVAQKAGAIVIECPDSIRNKGKSLQYIFEKFEKEHKAYDAYCIFDADNIVDALFLQKMNDCYLEGNHVAQGYKDSRNMLTSFNAFAMSIFFAIMNYGYNEGHKRFGLNAALYGSGLLIGSDIIKKIGYDPKTMAEDMEYNAVCSIHSVKIAWVHDALIKDEQPDSFISSIHQRRRWTAGQLQCLRLYGRQLLSKKNMQCLDEWLYLSGAAYMSISPVILLVNTVLTFAAGPFQDDLLIKLLFGGMAFVYVFFSAVMGIFLNLRRKDTPFVQSKWKTAYFLALPVYFWFWNLIALSALVYPPKSHIYIKHYGTDD